MGRLSRSVGVGQSVGQSASVKRILTYIHRKTAYSGPVLQQGQSFRGASRSVLHPASQCTPSSELVSLGPRGWTPSSCLHKYTSGAGAPLTWTHRHAHLALAAVLTPHSLPCSPHTRCHAQPTLADARSPAPPAPLPLLEFVWSEACVAGMVPCIEHLVH